MSSAEWQPFCLGLNVLNGCCYRVVGNSVLYSADYTELRYSGSSTAVLKVYVKSKLTIFFIDLDKIHVWVLAEFNPLHAKFFGGNIKHIFTLYVIPPH